MSIFGGLMEPSGPESIDLRDPAYVDFYRKALAEPDFGFGRAFKPGLLDPSWKRAGERLGEGISGGYASRGFGPLRTGPAAYAHADKLRELEESRATQEAGLGLDWARMITGWPGGASSMGSYTPGPSPFAELLGPFAGAMGEQYGGRVGRGETNPFSSLWSLFGSSGGAGMEGLNTANLMGNAGVMFT